MELRFATFSLGDSGEAGVVVSASLLLLLFGSMGIMRKWRRVEMVDAVEVCLERMTELRQLVVEVEEERESDGESKKELEVGAMRIRGSSKELSDAKEDMELRDSERVRLALGCWVATSTGARAAAGFGLWGGGVSVCFAGGGVVRGLS